MQFVSKSDTLLIKLLRVHWHVGYKLG
jgi:hypothetical protein